MNGFRDRTSWYLGVSAYWFATSFKWFALLLLILPAQVSTVVPENLKNTYWGRVFLVGAIWAVVGPAIFGFLSDRTRSKHGKRQPFIALGAGLTVLALTVLAQVKRIPEAPAPTAVDMTGLMILVVGYLLLQVSDDIGTGPYSAIIPELVPEERRGFASGLLGFARLLAQVVSGVVVFLFRNDWILVYTIIASLNILGALWVIWTIRGAKAPLPERENSDSFLQSFVRPWRSVDFRWVFVSSFLLALGFYLVQPYLQNYLRDVVRDFGPLGSVDRGTADERAGAPVQATAVVGLAISLSGAIGALLAAKFTDRIGRKKVVYVSGVIMLAALVPFALTTNYTAIIALAILFGFGYGARLSAEWALVSDVLPHLEDAGKDMGVWQMSQSSVQILAGGAGTVIDVLNRSRMGLGYTSSFLAASVLFVISTIVLKNVRGSK